MFVRKLAAVLMVLVAASAAQAAFSANWVLSTDLADPALVPPGTFVTATLTMDAYTPAVAGDDIARIQVSWVDSTADVTGGTWTWDAALAGLSGFVDSDMADLIVNRQNAGTGIVVAAPLTIGTLTFTAPMAEGDYTLDLTHLGDLLDTSLMYDGSTYLAPTQGLTISDNGDMDAGDDGAYDFHVMPEPATLALLGLGGLATLLRRRSR